MNASLRLGGVFVVGVLAWGAGGCATAHHHHRAAWSAITEAVAVMQPTAGHSARGVVTFAQIDGGVRIVADIEGLQPNAQHAFHVHEFGDARDPAGASAGAHYNPEQHPHGAPDDAQRHAGDLGNLQADGGGRAHFERVDPNITIAGLRNPVIGRSLIIHAKPDDFSQPTGNAGGRISIGVIGIAAKPAG